MCVLFHFFYYSFIFFFMRDSIENKSKLKNNVNDKQESPFDIVVRCTSNMNWKKNASVYYRKFRKLKFCHYFYQILRMHIRPLFLLTYGFIIITYIHSINCRASRYESHQKIKIFTFTFRMYVCTWL